MEITKLKGSLSIFHSEHRITPNILFYEILRINSRTTLATKCLSHTHTDRHFPEIVSVVESLN